MYARPRPAGERVSSICACLYFVHRSPSNAPHIPHTSNTPTRTQFPSKYTFNSKSDFTKVRRKNEFNDLVALLTEVEVLPSVVEDFLDVKSHLVPSRRYTPKPNVLKVSSVQAATTIDDITVSDEDNAIKKVSSALPGLLMINTILTLVGYIAALYLGIIESDATTTFRKLITCASIIVTVTFIRAILKKREWELQAALDKREQKKK